MHWFHPNVPGPVGYDHYYGQRCDNEPYFHGKLSPQAGSPLSTYNMEMIVAGIFHYVLGSGSWIGLYIMQTDANNAVMGLQPVEWQDPVIDEPKLRAARSGRLGLTFVVIAMRCWQAACQMFLPNRTTQRELDIQKRRDPAAEKEDIWNPNEWKRSAVPCPGLGCCGAFVSIARCRGWFLF